MIITSLAIAAVLVALTFIMHFAALKTLAYRIHGGGRSLRRPLLVVLFTLFAVHVLEVLVYAVAFYAMELLRIGHLGGVVETGAVPFRDHFYFSIASYTTLGIGDIFPHGTSRLVAGIEALNGLVLIAWSASFTYLMMERLWTGDRISET